MSLVEDFLPPVDLHWFFEISSVTGKFFHFKIFNLRSNLNPVQQTVAHMKTCINSYIFDLSKSIVWPQEVVEMARVLQVKIQQVLFGKQN